MELVNSIVPNFSASNSAPNLSLTKLLIAQPVPTVYYIYIVFFCHSLDHRAVGALEHKC
jgi:hypothetical protein